MGLRIFCPDESEPPPKATVLELTCDGDHGILPAPAARFKDGSYIEQYGAAMRAGWKDTFGRSQRLFLGPCCSGKRGQTNVQHFD